MRRSVHINTAGRFKSFAIRGVQSAMRDVENAGVGARCALNLSNTPKRALERGSLLADSALVDFVNTNHRVASRRPRPLRMECSFDLCPAFDTAGGAGQMRSIKVFHLTGDSLATVRFAGRSGIDGSKGDKVFGRVTLKRPLLCLRDDYFILRIRLRTGP